MIFQQIRKDNYLIREITLDDRICLQDLCEKCLDYYQIVEDKTPDSNSALEILLELPPDKSKEDKFVLGIFNDSIIIGVIDIVKDYPKRNEWIIGLLMLDPSVRSKGLGEKIHDLIKDWSLKNHAETLKICAAEDNKKACLFWKKLGYKEVGRKNVKLGNKNNVIIIMTLTI